MGRARSVMAKIRTGRSLDTYVTIVAAVILSALNITDVLPERALQGATSALLALLAINLLTLRTRIESLTTTESVPRPIPSLTELNCYPEPFDDEMERGGDLWIGGGNIGRLNPYYHHHILRRLNRGHSVRVLMVDPDSAAVGLMASRFPYPMDSAHFRQLIKANLKLIDEARREAKGNLEVRLTSDELSIGWTCLNIGTSKVRLYIQFFSYRASDHRNLKLVLDARHGEVFDHHMAQIEALWNAAQPYQKLVD